MKKIIITLIGLATSVASEIYTRITPPQSGNHLLWSILTSINVLIIIGLTIVINILITKYHCNKTIAKVLDNTCNANSKSDCYNANYMAPSFPYRQETYTPIIREPNSEPLYDYGNNSPISINDIAYKPKIEPLGASDINLINAIIKNTLNNLSHKYSISSLCIDLGNERTYLYRQVKGIYNCTPIDLVNAIKMAYTAKMLKETDIALRDIMFKVGMADNVVSFETYFKKFYYTSPFNYRETHKQTIEE